MHCSPEYQKSQEKLHAVGNYGVTAQKYGQTVSQIIDKLERKGVTHIPVTQYRGTRRIEAVLKDIGAVVEASPANKMIKDL